MHFLQSLLPWLERKQWGKGWSRLQKKGIKGVEGVGFQNRCVYDVGNGNNSWHAGDLLRGWFSCIRSLQGTLFMQEISSGVAFHAGDLLRGWSYASSPSWAAGDHPPQPGLPSVSAAIETSKPSELSFWDGRFQQSVHLPTKSYMVTCWCHSPTCWYLGVVSVDHVDKTNFVCFRISVD